VDVDTWTISCSLRRIRTSKSLFFHSPLSHGFQVYYFEGAEDWSRTPFLVHHYRPFPFFLPPPQTLLPKGLMKKSNFSWHMPHAMFFFFFCFPSPPPPRLSRPAENSGGMGEGCLLSLLPPCKENDRHEDGYDESTRPAEQTLDCSSFFSFLRAHPRTAETRGDTEMGRCSGPSMVSSPFFSPFQPEHTLLVDGAESLCSWHWDQIEGVGRCERLPREHFFFFFPPPFQRGSVAPATPSIWSTKARAQTLRPRH